jgi:hypothetical protein
MKTALHYIFIIVSILILALIAVPGLIIYFFTKFNIVEYFYNYCGRMERKYFGQW